MQGFDASFGEHCDYEPTHAPPRRGKDADEGLLPPERSGWSVQGEEKSKRVFKKFQATKIFVKSGCLAAFSG